MFPKKKLPSIQFGNDCIIPIEAVRNVGAIFDSTLSIVPQVNSLCKTASYHLRNIARIRHLLSKESTEILVHAFVFSKLDYCNALLYGLPQCVIKKLQLVQNSAARRITGNMTILLLSLYSCTGCLSLNESGLRYFSLLSKLFTSYHLFIYKNLSPNTFHLASSDPLMLCYLNVVLTISRPMAQERLEWQHRNYGTSFRGK